MHTGLSVAPSPAPPALEGRSGAQEDLPVLLALSQVPGVCTALACRGSQPAPVKPVTAGVRSSRSGKTGAAEGGGKLWRCFKLSTLPLRQLSAQADINLY